jgi:hypothetical protein
MKKRVFLETIQHELTGGSPIADNKSKYDLRIIAQRVQPYFDMALLEIYFQNKRDLIVLDNYTKAYIVTAYKDASRKETYIDLPVAVAGIPNNAAIRDIRPMKSPEGSLNQIPNNSIGMFNVLPAKKVFSTGSFYVEGQRAYMYNDTEGKEYIAKLVVGFDSYDDSDEVTIPVSSRGTIFDLTVNSMRGVQQTPADKTLDANDNQLSK